MESKLVTLALQWAAAHQQLVEGAALGFACAHLPELAGLAFVQAMKIPWLRGDVQRNPQRYKDAIKNVEDALDAKIDEVAQQPK